VFVWAEVTAGLPIPFLHGCRIDISNHWVQMGRIDFIKEGLFVSVEHKLKERLGMNRLRKGVYMPGPISPINWLNKMLARPGTFLEIIVIPLPVAFETSFFVQSS
jgi:hypothetical protein